MNYVVISPQEIQDNCKTLAKILLKNIPDIRDYTLVGINRGGLIPMGYLSYFLNNRNTEIIDVTLYEDLFEPDFSKIEASKQLVKNQAEFLRLQNKNILLIDDLVDSGESLKLTLDVLNTNSYNNHVKTAVVYQNISSEFKSDYYADVKPEGWLLFPWDQFDREEIKTEEGK